MMIADDTWIMVQLLGIILRSKGKSREIGAKSQITISSGLAKKEIGRVLEEIRERDKADLILIIGLIACVKEERLGIRVGNDSGVHVAILYKKMAVSMPLFFDQLKSL